MPPILRMNITERRFFMFISKYFSMSRLIRAVAAALILSLAVSLCGFSGECDEIRERVLRLHVLANSDSQSDQQLKLKVRDAVLSAAANLFDGAGNEKEALKAAEQNLAEIEKAAQQRVIDEGYNYKIKATICKMYFTTRQYGKVTLPAGIYDAVRITVGEGKGQNWWCVVFPPMCVSAAADAADLPDVLEPRQRQIVTRPQKFEIRFKIVEIFEDISRRFRSWFGN